MKVNFCSYHNRASPFSVRGQEMWEVELLFYREVVLQIVIYRVLQRFCSAGIGTGKFTQPEEQPFCGTVGIAYCDCQP